MITCRIPGSQQYRVYPVLLLILLRLHEDSVQHLLKGAVGAGQVDSVRHRNESDQRDLIHYYEYDERRRRLRSEAKGIV